MRVVSLLPSATELLCFVGGRPALAGRSHECDFPPGIEGVPVLTAQRTPPGTPPAEIDRLVREQLAGGGSLYTLNADLLASLRPDLILMDIRMPGLDGLAATRLIRASQPGARIVILTVSEDDADLFEAIKSGAQGYIFKNLDSEEFFRLLEGVARGEPALTPGLARKLLGEFARPPAPGQQATAAEAQSLTEREREVLNLLAQGVSSNRELAERLVVTENTVKYHLRNILGKLHLQNRAQVVSYALRHGLVERPESS